MKIVECPRDAMQGLDVFIPTEAKIRYINKLLKVGFDTIDFGSFVSPKAIPQLRDTAQVLEQLAWRESSSKLLAIVANTRGAEEAAHFEAISYVGFPLSISETFQQRNTNKSIAEALNTLQEIQGVCTKSGKQLITYISMGFGNPYGDPYDVAIVARFVALLHTLGCSIISLSDTVGVASGDDIQYLFTSLSKQYPHIEFGAHLHATAGNAIEKMSAAFEAGCRRFDGALKGFGGCPMANDELVGNLATETIVAYLKGQGVTFDFDDQAFVESLQLADEIFPKH